MDYDALMICFFFATFYAENSIYSWTASRMNSLLIEILIINVTRGVGK